MERKMIFTLILAAAVLTLAAACGKMFWNDAQDTAPQEVPVLICTIDGEKGDLVTGKWDFSSCTIQMDRGDVIGSTADCFGLASLHWDGESGIACPEYFRSAGLFQFRDDLSVTSVSSGTVISSELEIMPVENRYVLRYEGRNIPFRVKLTAAGQNEEYVQSINESGTSILSAFIKNGTAYLLLTSDAMTEDGLYLLCTAIDLESGTFETKLVNQAPFSFENIMLAVLDANNYGNDGNAFYFSTTDQIYKIDPETADSTAVISMDAISKNMISREFFDDIWASDNLIVVESKTYQGEGETYPNYHAFSLDGRFLATYTNTAQVVCAFPKR